MTYRANVRLHGGRCRRLNISTAGQIPVTRLVTAESLVREKHLVTNAALVNGLFLLHVMAVAVASKKHEAESEVLFLTETVEMIRSGSFGPLTFGPVLLEQSRDWRSYPR